MHFTDIPTAAAGNPHNSVLQIASEWGVPAAILFVAMVLTALWLGAQGLRRHATKPASHTHAMEACAYLGIFATAVQSLVNSNLSEPNSQLWMAIAFGLWMGSRQPVAPLAPCIPSAQPKRLHIYHLGVAAACIWLLWVVVRDVPQLREMERHYVATHGGPLKPRFWLQGMIHD